MRLGSGEDDDNLNDDSERRRRMDGIFSNNENGNRNKKFIVLGIFIPLLLKLELSEDINKIVSDTRKRMSKN